MKMISISEIQKQDFHGGSIGHYTLRNAGNLSEDERILAWHIALAIATNAVSRLDAEYLMAEISNEGKIVRYLTKLDSDRLHAWYLVVDALVADESDAANLYNTKPQAWKKLTLY